MKKYSLSGIAGIGKSTLLDLIKNNSKNLIVVNEPVRYLYCILKHETLYVRQLSLFSSFLSIEKEFEKDYFDNNNVMVVFDRPIVDTIVYSEIFNQIDLAKKMTEVYYNMLINKEISGYNKLFYLTVDPNILFKNKSFIEKNILKDTVRKSTLNIFTVNDYVDYVKKHNDIFYKYVNIFKDVLNIETVILEYFHPDYYFMRNELILNKINNE